VSPVEVDTSYTVMCPYSHCGCSHSCSRKDVEAHIKTCPFRYERRPKSRASSLTQPTMRERYSMMLLQLSLEVLNFASDCKQSEELLHGIVEAALHVVKEAASKTVDENLTHTKICVFGSRAMSLALPASDIDIVVDFVPKKKKEKSVKSDTECLRLVAANLESGNWLEWIKFIETATIPVIKLCAWSDHLLRKTRDDLAQITAEERSKVSKMQAELQKCMENILSSHGFDVESTDRMAIVAKELGQLQRKVLYRCNRSNNESPTASAQHGIVLSGEGFFNKSQQNEDNNNNDDDDDVKNKHRKSSSDMTLKVPPSSPVSLSVKQAVTTLSVHGKTASSSRLTLDITLKSHMGVETVSFVNQLVDHFPELRPLVLVIKQLLNSMRLNDPYTGGLGSYALVIMVASLLQRRQCEDEVGDEEDEDDEYSGVSNTTSPRTTSRSPRNRDKNKRNSGEYTLGSLNEKLKRLEIDENEKKEDEEDEKRRSSINSNRSLDPLRLGEVLLDFLQVYGTEFNPSKDFVELNLSTLEGFEHFESISKVESARNVSAEHETNSTTTTTTTEDEIKPPSRGERKYRPFTLRVLDPLQPNNNVTRTCFAFSQIQHVFTQVLIQILLMGKNTTHVGGKSLLKSAGFFR